MIEYKIKNKILYPLTQLIEREKEENKLIKGNISYIEDDVLEVNINKDLNISLNSIVEINRQKAFLIKNKNKTLFLKLLDNNNDFHIYDEISIYNIQKDIIIRKLEELKLNILNNHDKDNTELLNILFDYRPPNYEKSKYKCRNLNKNQSIAVNKSLTTNMFHIIQGPPGTGKTHTIVEIINQLYKKDLRILITAHTHIALDNIIEKLDMIPQNNILRLGDELKISKNTKKYTINNHIQQDPEYIHIIKRKEKIRKLKEKSYENYSFNIEKSSDESIISKIFRKLLRLDDNISYTQHINTQEKEDIIYNLEEEIEKIREKIEYNIIKKIPIVASTVIASSNYLIHDINFDYVIMDESSQVPLYLALIALMKTKKFIIIGDNKQLQPIINNNASLILNKSIFNYLIEKYPEYSTFLNIQYRMNSEISAIASKLYYNNKLKTYTKIRNQKITLKNNRNFLLNESPITFIDTSNMEYTEDNISKGCCNKYEAKLVLKIVVSLINMNFDSDSIGVITPYKRHKNHIKRLLYKNNLNVETDTIYRFQGRQKDVIILCFCKSREGMLSKFQENFISNQNQLNVSITRSCKKLIIIGDISLLSQSKNIKNLINEISTLNNIFLSDCI